MQIIEYQTENYMEKCKNMHLDLLNAKPWAPIWKCPGIMQRPIRAPYCKRTITRHRSSPRLLIALCTKESRRTIYCCLCSVIMARSLVAYTDTQTHTHTCARGSTATGNRRPCDWHMPRLCRLSVRRLRRCSCLWAQHTHTHCLYCWVRAYPSEHCSHPPEHCRPFKQRLERKSWQAKGVFSPLPFRFPFNRFRTFAPLRLVRQYSSTPANSSDHAHSRPYASTQTHQDTKRRISVYALRFWLRFASVGHGRVCHLQASLASTSIRASSAICRGFCFLVWWSVSVPLNRIEEPHKYFLCVCVWS